MRLLKRDNTGAYSLTEDLVGDDSIPPYAILSHTWVDGQEVTFQDLVERTGGGKSGYDKLSFCAEQAKRDGLQYFWVDTCCIDKSNHAELSREVINTFSRYHNASRCYVYLSDVPYPLPSADNIQTEWLWKSAFRRSRWFTRGWTLQELLAPSSVEFFTRKNNHSQEHKRLGDKCSLKQLIHEITGISNSALEGSRMSQFTVDERLMWMERRQTTVPEDKFYSLLGLFDVKMPLIYGEGAAQAHARLREVIDKQEKCTQDLYISDPRDDKKRIEETEGGLLKDAYRWILDNSDFRQWRSTQQNILLWVKGDPGKGKTMLLCGIIDELEQSEAQRCLLSYFFCQATDARINNATAVLRGLIYMLVRQQPSLASYVRKKYDQIGKKVFEDANAWFALTEIFINILEDPSLSVTYLIIDALDECVEDLPRLLHFIREQSAAISRQKWIVSSRNSLQIEQQLKAQHQTRLSLELNTQSVLKAVQLYTEYKVSELAQHHGYNDHTQSAILQHLSRNADGTFLLAASVCQKLQGVGPKDVLHCLEQIFPGLDRLQVPGHDDGAVVLSETVPQRGQAWNQGTDDALSSSHMLELALSPQKSYDDTEPLFRVFDGISQLSFENPHICALFDDENRTITEVHWAPINHQPPFSYDEMGLSETQIRLMRVNIDRDGYAIGWLERFEFHAAPPYRALSYMWGEQKSFENILVNNEAFKITETLHCFLKLYAARHPAEYIWIDQICIAQDTINERTAQVKLMSEIFKGSVEVMIWINPADRLSCWIENERDHYKANRDGQSTYMFKDCDKLVDLVRSKYWMRVWVLQEILLARTRTIYYGHSILSWAELEHIVEANKSDSEMLASKQLKWLLQQTKNAPFGRMHLIDAADLWSTVKASDSRDMVYALYGLLVPAHRVQVDYHKTVKAVFIDTAAKCARYIPNTDGLTNLAISMRISHHEAAGAGLRAFLKESLSPCLENYSEHRCDILRRDLDTGLSDTPYQEQKRQKQRQSRSK
jgi:hypothetical protein